MALHLGIHILCAYLWVICRWAHLNVKLHFLNTFFELRRNIFGHCTSCQCQHFNWHWSVLGIDLKYLSISIDRHWDQCRNFDRHWAMIQGILCTCMYIYKLSAHFDTFLCILTCLPAVFITMTADILLLFYSKQLSQVSPSNDSVWILSKKEIPIKIVDTGLYAVMIWLVRENWLSGYYLL